MDAGLRRLGRLKMLGVCSVSGFAWRSRVVGANSLEASGALVPAAWICVPKLYSCACFAMTVEFWFGE